MVILKKNLIILLIYFILDHFSFKLQIHHNGQNRSAYFDKFFYNYIKSYLFHSNTNIIY